MVVVCDVVVKHEDVGVGGGVGEEREEVRCCRGGGGAALRLEGLDYGGADGVRAVDVDGAGAVGGVGVEDCVAGRR